MYITFITLLSLSSAVVPKMVCELYVLPNSKCILFLVAYRCLLTLIKLSFNSCNSRSRFLAFHGDNVLHLSILLFYMLLLIFALHACSNWTRIWCMFAVRIIGLLYFSLLGSYFLDLLIFLSLLFPFLSFVSCWLTNTPCQKYDTLLYFLVTVTSGFLSPTFVSFWCRLSRASSRLALDNAIRHKQLNISSRFSPRVAGENDFLQTVINKVITAKEVNHKGQGRYFVHVSD